MSRGLKFICGGFLLGFVLLLAAGVGVLATSENPPTVWGWLAISGFTTLVVAWIALWVVE